MGIKTEEIDFLWKQLLQIAEEVEKLDSDKDAMEGEVYQVYSTETESGKRFYEALEDEVLLDYLRNKTKELGRSPAQKEIFWVLRGYIKERFQKWPYALKAAGLCKAAGKGGKTLVQIQAEKEDYEQQLETVRQKAIQICRIPHPKDLPEMNERVVKYAKSWGQVIQDAGIDECFFQEHAVYKVKEQDAVFLEDLAYLKELAAKLHRPPLRGELDDKRKERLLEKCGSYRNALYQIGLEPIKRRNPFLSVKTGSADAENRKEHSTNLQNCYYQIVAPDAQTTKDLKQLYDYQREHGEMPDRKAVNPDFRKRLQNSCGSWANAIYQIHYKETSGEV